MKQLKPIFYIAAVIAACLIILVASILNLPAFLALILAILINVTAVACTLDMAWADWESAIEHITPTKTPETPDEAIRFCDQIVQKSTCHHKCRDFFANISRWLKDYSNIQKAQDLKSTLYGSDVNFE